MEEGYLGDSVYVKDDNGYGVCLYLNNGLKDHSPIVLELEVLKHFIDVLKKSKYKDLLF